VTGGSGRGDRAKQDIGSRGSGAENKEKQKHKRLWTWNSGGGLAGCHDTKKRQCCNAQKLKGGYLEKFLTQRKSVSRGKGSEVITLKLGTGIPRGKLRKVMGLGDNGSSWVTGFVNRKPKMMRVLG